MANRKRRFSINGSKLKDLMSNYNLQRSETFNEYISKFPEDGKALISAISNDIEQYGGNNEYISLSELSAICKKYQWHIDKRHFFVGLENYEKCKKKDAFFIHGLDDYLYRSIPDSVGESHLHGHITIEQLADVMNVGMSTVKDWRNGEMPEDDLNNLCKKFNISKNYLIDKNTIICPLNLPKWLPNLPEDLTKFESLTTEYEIEYWKSLNRLDQKNGVIESYEEIDANETISRYKDFLSFATKTSYMSDLKEEVSALSQYDIMCLSIISMNHLHDDVSDYISEHKAEGKDNG